MSTKNKIALVTGGSRGLGRDMVLNLAGTGLDVIFTYNSNLEEAEKVASEVKQIGQKAWVFKLDASRTETFDSFMENVANTLLKDTGSTNFDYLVNNAGTALYAPLTETTEEQFDAIINIHFKGVFFLTQKALKQMNNGGAIVNISSGLARFSYVGSSVYGSTKGAVETLTRYMAKELGERKIRANVVAPGAIETDFGGGHVRDNRELNAQIAGNTALGRVGLPDDIGSVVAFLCSDASKWVNAQRIEVSGGIWI